MATSRNCTGDQDQNVCGNGRQIHIDTTDAEPNQVGKMKIGVLGARNKLAHSTPINHPTHFQCTLHFRIAKKCNSGNSGPVNGSSNGYGGSHGCTLHIWWQQTLSDVGIVRNQYHTEIFLTPVWKQLKADTKKKVNKSVLTHMLYSSNAGDYEVNTFPSKNL